MRLQTIFSSCLKSLLCYIMIYMDSTRAAEDYLNPRHYVLNLTQTNWQDAGEICSKDGAYLATVYDYSTIPDLELVDSLKDTEEALVWIGLTKSDTASWSWSNAEGSSYENWKPGDDDNTDTDDGCVAVTFREPYYWSIKPCSLRLPFICQYQEEGQCRFEVNRNASIAAHNYMYLYQKTAQECQEVCVTNSVFLCQSFEYDPAGKRCQFNSGNRWTLSTYYSSHKGWDYYHRTCNSGEVTGMLLDLTSSIVPSSTVVVSSTSSTLITPTPSIIPVRQGRFQRRQETSSIEIQCSELFVTKDIFVTKDVFVTHDVLQTRDVTVTNDVFVTRDIHVTRDVFLTNSVVLSTTITETAFVTTTSILTTTVTLTPSPVMFIPSDSIYEDPVEELMVLETEIKEKAKTLKKISIKDDRPSATYVGYFAILFLSCVFGAILIFDMLTIFQSGMCKKCMKLCKGKNGKAECGLRKPNMHAVGKANDAFAWNEDCEHREDPDSPNVSTGSRLWRKSLWAVGDSGFGGSNSLTTNSETDNRSNDGSRERDNTKIVTIEIQDTVRTRGNSSPSSSDVTTSSVISTEQGVVTDDGDCDNDEVYFGNVIDTRNDIPPVGDLEHALTDDGVCNKTIAASEDIQNWELCPDKLGNIVKCNEERTTYF